ncbi:MAG: UvrD-helicase domain-containing protein [Lachnospiraceae bacterium]|nr:UvrD-helicase domain-containing protein [Lachnospiraceae bacterium]
MDIFSELNEAQKSAVLHTEGPVLILAGAGSGKTRTIVSRMAYLMKEKGVVPWHILAVTFTNKAAKEMKERIGELMEGNADGIWVSTFHSACLRILFRHAGLLGYPDNFEIADAADQKALLKEVYKDMSVDPKRYPEKMTAREISRAKDELMSPENFAEASKGDFSLEMVAEIYRAYQASLKRNASMDFDDLIMNTVRLFQEYPDVLDHWQERFQYILVDEYQDTNTAQFTLLKLLASKYKNLCVVGDDDQSIYRFRGANIYNILDFEKYYPGAKVVRLEENYRSTGNILSAANAVISKNRLRKTKTLWTSKAAGDRISFRQLDSPMGEASFIADDIKSKVSCKEAEYGDFAVLVRTNIQTKEIEDAFRINHISYDVVKGLRFWDTKVIKDLTSYLLTVAGSANDVRTVRIINLPRRGIGPSTVEKLLHFAREYGISLLEACGDKGRPIPISSNTRSKVRSFYDLIVKIRKETEGFPFSSILEKIIDETDYMNYLLQEAESKEKYEEMRQYIDKLKETLDSYEAETDNPDIVDFMRQNGLEGNALDKNSEDGTEKNRVLIMTMHNAKGLEFPYVYMAGAEEGLFPGYSAISMEDPMEMEEERRLCYVAITRAKKKLTISCARQRMVRGELKYASTSRFMKEIPANLLDTIERPQRATRYERKLSPERESAHEAFIEKPLAFSKEFQQLKKGGQIGGRKPDYEEGDSVQHFKFGQGKVLSIKAGERDYEVTVDFETVGVRKMFAGFAKLKKI